MKLKGKKIGVLVAPLFDDIELYYPYYRLQEEGAEIVIIGPERDRYSGKRGLTAESHLAIAETRASDYDAVVIPGGYAPDHMRRNSDMVEFVREMDKQHKVVAAICHGPWMMVSAGIVAGKKLTSFFSIKDDLVNAGAEWVDAEVIRTDNLITSRRPDDLPAFCASVIEALSGI
jgi:protease I